MTRMSTGGTRPQANGAENDVYTALILVAFLFVVTATIYVGYRAYSLFGTLLPPPGG